MAVTNYALNVIRERLEKSCDVVTFLKLEGNMSFWEIEKGGKVQTVKRDANFKAEVLNLGEYWQVHFGNEWVKIVKIQDHGFLAKKDNQYRIDDKHGRTVATMFDNFQSAKSKAIKYVKELTKQ
jgi:hypothetical protein